MSRYECTRISRCQLWPKWLPWTLPTMVNVSYMIWIVMVVIDTTIANDCHQLQHFCRWYVQNVQTNIYYRSQHSSWRIQLFFIGYILRDVCKHHYGHYKVRRTLFSKPEPIEIVVDNTRKVAVEWKGMDNQIIMTLSAPTLNGALWWTDVRAVLWGCSSYNGMVDDDVSLHEQVTSRIENPHRWVSHQDEAGAST